MSVLSAITKGILRALNDGITKGKTKKAKRNAFQNTGRRMSAAKKQHRFIDGKKAYKQELRKEMRCVEKHHAIRNQFIDDL